MELLGNSDRITQVTEKLASIVEALKSLDYGKSISFPIETDAVFLEEAAKEFSKGQKAYVVVCHEEHKCYELAMLPCGQTRNLYYSLLAKVCKMDTEKDLAEVSIIEKMQKYLDSEYSKVKSYGNITPEMFFSRVIPYGYIQRSCSTLAIFKNTREGAKNKILSSLETLIQRGEIKEIPEKEMFEKYQTRSRAFKLINKKVDENE